MDELKFTPDEIKKKMDDLQRRAESVSTKRAALAGELKAKKEELATLVTEIKTAGYNPSTLIADRNAAQKELEALMESFERDLSDVETSLSAYDAPKKK